MLPPKTAAWLFRIVAVVPLLLCSCGEHGLLPTTVDEGPDFSVADVVFSESFFYCKVEPMMLDKGCGSGDPARGESAGGCHASVTAFRFTPYMPTIGSTCGDTLTPGTVAVVPPVTAQEQAIASQNYQSAQARMRRDPEIAPLLNRPIGRAQHPRAIFDASSPEADLLRQWATQYSTR